MSTVMYAFRATSEENLHEQIGIMKFLARNFHPVKCGIDVRVFSTSAGIIFQVLEPGYILQNEMRGWGKFFTPCDYDDRADIQYRDLPNKIIAEQVMAMTNRRAYHLFTIVEPRC